ncbi:SDR family oxidoreductase [Candidatus Binatia bacterium]|nr:SDR family oxidoreductase [Candidatus Binatia bacterium]
MEDTADRAIAIVGVGAILPDAPNASVFWENLRTGRYSITDVSPERWDPALYYDPDPKAPDKTYSKIGGWVRAWEWNPLQWGLPIPPRVSEAMDDGQKWAVACTRETLADYGHPQRPLDLDRTAVIIGNAMAGEKHYLTAMRVYFPEFARELEQAPSFSALPAAVQAAIAAEAHARFDARLPEITEDTMPGELSNCIAGRLANLFNFRGPNFVVDAACASAMAAVNAAVEGLVEHEFDAAVCGGIDRNMGASSFIKFCKIGALSATGTRPYAEGADGFVMGEGAAIFLLKRLVDAERSGDKIYALIRGVGGASDGKGKGITAPNPVGQRLAVERAWRNAGVPPASCTYVEGHGTSTRVGDVVEVESLTLGFGETNRAPGSIALGSVKSNIGHLKAAAGAAGLLKAALATHHKLLPPSLNFGRPNPNIDFSHSPFAVNTTLRPWEIERGGVRRAGVSAFGFGGTNFHIVLEEHVPGALTAGEGKRTSVSVPSGYVAGAVRDQAPKAPLRGALVIGGADTGELLRRLEAVQKAAAAGNAPAPAAPAETDLHAPERIAIDYGDAAELADKAARAVKAFAANNPGMWKALRAQGIFRGRGPAPKVAFLYTGQGSQYANMLRDLRAVEPVVEEVFTRADRVMTPLLAGKPLSGFIFVDPDDPRAIAGAEDSLRQTAITQPAVLAVDHALTKLLAAYGIKPDMVMGHSLGEYGALIAAGALPFDDALEAVSARGREMTKLSVDDNGLMAAVFGPLPEVERMLKEIDGYVVIANVNSNSQSVIGGATPAVQAAIEKFTAAGFNAVPLPVSHAFHTRIVALASEPLRATLRRLRLAPPALPIVANVTGEFYPMGSNVVPQMLDLLAEQVAAPVQFVKGLQTLYDAGARCFVEVGPKKALQGFVDDVLGDRPEVASLFCNHPKLGDLVAFNQALCGLYAAGFGIGATAEIAAAARPVAAVPPVAAKLPVTAAPLPVHPSVAAPAPAPRLPALGAERYSELGKLFAEFLERGMQIYGGRGQAARGLAADEPVAVTGAALGLPGTEKRFDDANIGRILDGQQFIDVIPSRFRKAMLDKRITRLVKSDEGGARFESIDSAGDVIKLAGRGGAFDLAAEYGVSAERIPALDITTRMAIAAGIDALRDAGIPLVMRYKETTRGTYLPDRWMLPDELRDDTGVIFAAAFPGYDALVADLSHYFADGNRREQLATLEQVRARLGTGRGNDHDPLAADLDHRIHELKAAIEKDAYTFDRRFIFKILAMGHSQFAELIGARGPNTHINAACASTTQGVALAQDWIRTGRCRRVVIIAADDFTSDALLEWTASGFLATGAAATDDVVEEAALPFDRRRHGMIVGMGAAAIVVESAEAARERGIRPICEVLAAATANSAFHGTRLDVDHIGRVMESLLREAETQWGIDRYDIAPQTVFVSHETYTPARGGSASAEVFALRGCFGAAADRIVVANTKGFTGHAMGAGIEDVVAIKSLETGIVPPVANFKEVDPELGPLNLSRGGAYPVEYALRLGAGFGSQIAMTLYRHVPAPDGLRPDTDELGYATRLADPVAFQAWVCRAGGHPAASLEVVNRTLRVRDRGPTQRVAAAAERAQPTAPQATAPRPTAAVPAADLVAPGRQPAPPPPAPVSDTVREQVLRLFAEKTGYPPDMLDPELDLEADLGIDTVKQAEMFAAIRGAYEIPRDDKLKLRDFPTLAHVIQFVYDRRPDLKAAPAAQTAAEVAPLLAVPASASAPTSASPAGLSDPVRERILQLFAEKTGYPPDMLDPELDLEADLGIDTVKQAEMFAAIRGAYEIPRDDKLKLRDFPTLAHVIQFVYDRRPDLKAAPAAQTAAEVVSPPSAPAPASGPAEAPTVLPIDVANRVPRRVPVPVLRPALDVCKPTAVQLGAGARVLVMPDRGGVARALKKKLEKLGVEVLQLDPAETSDQVVERVKGWTAAGPVRGVYWLPALDNEGDLRAMDLAAWRAALGVRVKLLYAAMRALYEQIMAPGTFLVSATLLGGQHGYDDPGAVAPMGGSVVGFAKTYKRERPEALVKAVDFEVGRKAADVAGLLIDETLADPGVVEVGYKSGQRWTVALAEQPVRDGDAGLALDRNSVFVVTGAAGSIVSAITADLAAACGGTFYLLDLVPEPDPGNADIRRFVSDRENLKRDIFERLKARGERATPALVERELAALERAHAALAAIEAVRAAGGTPRYYRVDLTQPDAVARVIEDVRENDGRIDVLLHCAGLEISRFLPDKEPREFDLVFDVKSDGWFNLLHAIGDLPLAATVAFSSIAGRFGNGGQADYAAANDLLCKIASSFRATRPATRAIAIDWTAWGGIGMATRGSIPKMMEMAGIDMLPPDTGIATVRRELTAAGDFRGEVVVAGRLGILMKEWDTTGGIDAARLDERRGPRTRGPMVGRIAGMSLYDGLTAETVLDPKMQPFLFDHRIDGTPVLPGVMGIEGFAELATTLLPDWHVAAIEDVNFLAPFKFYRDESRVLTLQAQFVPAGDGIVACCRLSGVRNLPGQTEPQVTIHFTARVRLTRAAPKSLRSAVPNGVAGNAVGPADVYRIYFHGPAYRVIENVWRDGGRTVGLLAGALPEHHRPAEAPLAVAPRLIELCFQTAGIWQLGTKGQMALPSHIDRVDMAATPASGNGPLYAVVVSRAAGEGVDAQVVDASGSVYVTLHGYRTVELPSPVDAERLAPLREAMS